MTRHFCDRCGDEGAELKNVASRLQYSAAGGGTIYHGPTSRSELCHKCWRLWMSEHRLAEADFYTDTTW